MTGRKLATPGAVLILAGAFLMYWGLREFGVIGQPTPAPAPAPAPAPKSGIAVTPGPGSIEVG